MYLDFYKNLVRIMGHGPIGFIGGQEKSKVIWSNCGSLFRKRFAYQGFRIRDTPRGARPPSGYLLVFNINSYIITDISHFVGPC